MNTKIMKALIVIFAIIVLVYVILYSLPIKLGSYKVSGIHTLYDHSDCITLSNDGSKILVLKNNILYKKGKIIGFVRRSLLHKREISILQLSDPFTDYTYIYFVP